jgi:RNA polymerase sigma-70 factor (ECF subfamily)
MTELTLQQARREHRERTGVGNLGAPARHSHHQAAKLSRSRPRQDWPRSVDAGQTPVANTETLVSLIDGVCRHDPKRWDQFDAIYRPIMMEFLRKRGLSAFDADEVVQNVYLKLLAKIQSYDRAKSSFRSWLFTVVKNTLIDAARRRASHERALKGWVFHVLQTTESESVELEETWTRLHRERVLKDALRTVRTRVSSRVWACFVQRVFHELPAAAVASDLGMEPNAVYVNACRVMKHVRQYCLEFEEDMSQAFAADVI